MILADKIINERKKNGWSQEELAEKLSVSRQSVSKWEGAQAAPDLQKIIAMADLFGVSTDYLLKDEIEAPRTVNASTEIKESVVSSEDVRRVSLEEASDYLEVTRKHTPLLANCVSLCILAPVVLIFLVGLSESKIFAINEGVVVLIGLLFLFGFIAFAVYNFVMIGSKMEKYEFLEKESIETAYGVDGMAKERKNLIESKRTSGLAIGVIMCVLSPVPIIVSALIGSSDMVIISMVSLLLFIIATAVNIFIRSTNEWTALDKLLQTGDFTVENKRANKQVDRWSGAYWGLVVAGYLGWSFISARWDFTWIVWPIAALLYAAIGAFVRAKNN